MMVRMLTAICICAAVLGHIAFRVPSVDRARGSTLHFEPQLKDAVRRAVVAPLLAVASEPGTKIPLALTAPVVGIASVYNPAWPGGQEGGPETASGETYNPLVWTAAIQTELRDRFGGVRYGKDYRPAFALVEQGERRAIVKINDIGTLKSGRIIDFNERTMRYFDPTLELGLIERVKVTPLIGDDWPTGPVDRAS